MTIDGKQSRYYVCTTYLLLLLHEIHELQSDMHVHVHVPSAIPQLELPPVEVKIY